jgi:hypothetical protein
MPAVEVLIVAGLHEPFIELFEVPGREGADEFWHKGPIWENDGVSNGSITIFIVTVVAHWPADGVKV